jgi:hypothetical protein
MQKITIEVGQTIHGTKFSVSKTLNPNTNRESHITTDFSFVVWGEVTADYLVSAKKLKKEQFQRIFDDALRSVPRFSGKYKRAINSAADERLKSHRADLQSDSDSSSDQEKGLGGADRDRDSKFEGGDFGGGDFKGGKFEGGEFEGGEFEGGEFEGNELDDKHLYPIDHGHNDW